MAVRSTKWRSGKPGFSTNRIWLACLILASLVLLLVSYSDAALSRVVRMAFAEVSAPALRWLAAPVGEFRSKVSNAGSYVFLIDEVARLRDENKRLRGMRSEITGLENRLLHYEELLKVRPPPQSRPVITTRILADASGPFVKTALIDAGTRQGVRKGYAVIGARGLIGRTVSVGSTSTRVLLLNDLNSRVPVRIEPAGYRAILAGANSDTPYLDFMPIGSVLRAGNRVVTSGHGGMFPAGLPVGIVETVEGKIGAFRVLLDAPPEFVETVQVLEPVVFGDPDDPGIFDEPDLVELDIDYIGDNPASAEVETGTVTQEPGALVPTLGAQN